MSIKKVDSIILFVLVFIGAYFILSTLIKYGSLVGFISNLWQNYLAIPLIVKTMIIMLSGVFVSYFLYRIKPSIKTKKLIKNISICAFIVFGIQILPSLFSPGQHSVYLNNPLLVQSSNYLKLNTMSSYISAGMFFYNFIIFIVMKIMVTKNFKGLKKT